MPRGFKVDKEATRLACLDNTKSFVSQPKAIPGECDEPRPHLILYGQDKRMMRSTIFQHNREKNHGTTRCAECNRRVWEEGAAGRGILAGEWHHVRNKGGERCDCQENGEVRCRECHGREHPKPQFGQAVT